MNEKYPPNDVRNEFTDGPWMIGTLGTPDGMMPELDPEKMVAAFRESILLGPKGNRCYFVVAKIGGEDVTVAYTGNGPTSRQNAQIISYVPELVAQIDEQDAELTRLRAIVARCEDVEGMAETLSDQNETVGWSILDEHDKERYRYRARAVRDYLLKGEG